MSLIRINRHPTKRQLIVFGLAWLGFGCAVAALLWKRDRTDAAKIVAGLAAAVPLVGVIFPRWLRLVYVGLSFAVYPIGFVVSHVVLAVVYYLVVTPLGWALRLGGYDPLARRRGAASASYWQRREGPKSPGSYFRQT